MPYARRPQVALLPLIVQSAMVVFAGMLAPPSPSLMPSPPAMMTHLLMSVPVTGPPDPATVISPLIADLAMVTPLALMLRSPATSKPAKTMAPVMFTAPVPPFHAQPEPDACVAGTAVRPLSGGAPVLAAPGNCGPAAGPRLWRLPQRISGRTGRGSPCSGTALTGSRCPAGCCPSGTPRKSPGSGRGPRC